MYQYNQYKNLADLACLFSLKLRFCEKDAKFLQNHHLRFVLCSNSQVYGGDFAKLCGLLRIYELYYDVISDEVGMQ